MKSEKRSQWLPHYLALGTVWGCSFIFIKLGLEFLSPFGVAFGRTFLGALTLLIVLIVRHRQYPKFGTIWLHLWFVSLLLNSLPGVLFALAETHVTSILAGILNATTPLMTIVVMFIAFREEKIKRYQLLGLFIGGVGVLVVLGVWRGLGNNPGWAIAILLIATLGYGISFPYSRKFIIPAKLQPESAAATQLLLASATLFPFFLIDGFTENSIRLTTGSAMAALGILGSGFAYIWNFHIIEKAGSAIASTVTYVTPVVAVIVGIIFLNENLSWYEPCGGLIVILGAAISQGKFTSFSAKKS